ncbi:hypothetical protein Hanom_Chr13g01239741 [Helianthus anomalus]
MKMFMWSSGSDEPLYFPTLNGNFVVVTRACAIRGANLEFCRRRLWPVRLCFRAFCSHEVCIAGMSGGDIVASSRSAAGVMRLPAICMVIRVGIIVPFGVW